MLTKPDIDAFAEMNAALEMAGEARFEAAVMREHCPHWQEYERRRREIYDQIGGAR